MSESADGAKILAIPSQARRVEPAPQPGGRHRAEPVAEETAVDAPTALVGRLYDTPAWVRPGDFGVTEPTLPTEQGRVIGRILEHGAALSYTRPESLVHHARWVTPRNGTSSLALLLVSAVAAAGATGSGLLQRQSTPMLALTLVLLLAASGLNAVLVALRPTVVELDEAWLKVRHRGRSDQFDLSNPFQRLRINGEPGTSSWSVDLGCADGRVVTITAGMADSTRLAPVIAYAQQYAERDRRAREERFSR